MVQPHKDREGDTLHEPPPKKEPRLPQRTKATQSADPQNPLAIRTIVIAGLPPSVDSKALWKKVRKYEGADKVEWPAKIKGEDDPTIGKCATFKEVVSLTFLNSTRSLLEPCNCSRGSSETTRTRIQGCTSLGNSKKAARWSC